MVKLHPCAGQTGSGKTHTIMGERHEAGAIALAIDDIFATTAAAPADQFAFRVMTKVSHNSNPNPDFQTLSLKHHSSGPADQFAFREMTIVSHNSYPNSQFLTLSPKNHSSGPSWIVCVQGKNNSISATRIITLNPKRQNLKPPTTAIACNHCL